MALREGKTKSIMVPSVDRPPNHVDVLRDAARRPRWVMPHERWVGDGLFVCGVSTPSVFTHSYGSSHAFLGVVRGFETRKYSGELKEMIKA